MAGTTSQAGVDLDARYGRTPARSKQRRRLIIAAVVALILVIGAWVVWAGHDDVTTTVSTEDTGNTVIDDYTVSITFDLSMKPGSTANCALQAQNEAHGIVGWKIVEIPASKVFTRSFTNTVRTSERALVGLIYRCWLT